MTFRLKNARATHQRAMNYIFHDLIGRIVEIYIDEAVKSKSSKEHLADLRNTLECTRKNGLKMNPNKCAFGVLAGQFLGFTVHERGIEVSQRSIKGIKDTIPPLDQTELQFLIGKINFVRCFISNLSRRMEPFMPLLKLKAGQKFVWGEQQQQAFDDIKDYLSSPPVLIAPKPHRPFKLYLSADEHTIASVLVQEINGKEHAVFYLGRRLLDA